MGSERGLQQRGRIPLYPLAALGRSQERIRVQELPAIAPGADPVLVSGVSLSDRFEHRRQRRDTPRAARRGGRDNVAPAAVNLDVADIQGLVASGYRRLRSADYLLFRIRDGRAARKWLGDLAGRLTTAQAPVINTGLNLALTSSGLQRLGLDDDSLGSFPSEFIEGMATPHRSRMLGDEAASKPGNWRWGGNEPNAVDLVLMLFALDVVTLGQLRHGLAMDTIAGLEQVTELHTADLGDHEHFGFADGISQPTILGFGRPAPSRDLIQPGEFILGYANEYGLIPPGPMVNRKADRRRILTQAGDRSGAGDLGR